MHIEKLAHYTQEEKWDCGAGVAELVLKNLGCTEIDHKKLIEMLGTNEKEGTQLNKLVRFFNSLPELESKIKILATFEDLKAEIDKGRICIVAYQNWESPEDLGNFESGHYAVVVEITQDRIKMLDTGEDNGEYEFDRWDFEHRWVEIDGENNEDLFEGWMMSLRIPSAEQ
jgi:ABC-type bacteriocin/lantibiotic exporter with double-glycine peptidase domain